jgi:hypothetical protein
MLRTRLRNGGVGTTLIPSFTPLDISGCVVWLDPSQASTLWADTAGTTPATAGVGVARIDNKGSYGGYFQQTGATSKPITGTRTINGLNGLDFDGANDSMTMASLADQLTGDHTIHVINQADSYGSNVRILEFNCPGQFKLQIETSGTVLSASHTPAFFFSTLARAGDTNPHLTGQYKNGSNVYAFEDGVDAAPASANTTGSGQCTWGSDEFGLNRFNGVMGEVTMYNRSLTLSERAALETYYYSKWGFL